MTIRGVEVCCFFGMVDSICIFARWAKIKVATSVCTGGSNMPPAYCDWIIRVPPTNSKSRDGMKPSLLFELERNF